MVDWVAGSGNVVVYTDMSREPSDRNPSAVWSMYAQNLRTGKRWLVSSSHGVANNSAPLVTANQHKAVWNVPDADHRTSDMVVQDLRTRKTAVVRRHVWPSIPVITADSVVYTDNYPPGAPVDPTVPPKAREVYAVSLSGGPARDIGGHHRAASPAAGDGYAVWGEPMYGDQQQVWSAPVDGGGRARLIYRGGNVQQEVGTSFAAIWQNLGGLVVVPLRTAGKPFKISRDIYVPAHFSAEGKLVAFASIRHMNRPNELITINVVAVDVDDPQ